MKFISEDNLEFDTIEELSYWNKYKKRMISTKRKTRIDKGAKRVKYNSLLPKKYIQYQRRANAKQLSFSLSVDEFNSILNQSCVYCGTSNRITIDRIESKLGYELDNVVPCCQQCNTMKFTYSVDQFIGQVERIYKHNKSREEGI